MSVINTNITSLIGQHNLSKSQSALQTAMERLSSGLRINSAKDDAAGQAIANRMTAQITGLNQAARNANDGISIAQTAEGSLNQVNDNLQRIRELSVQAANGTNSPDDLQSIQDEINQRLEEIDRISRETEFNSVSVLAEDVTSLTIQVGANDGQTIEVGLRAINVESLGLNNFSVLRATEPTVSEPITHLPVDIDVSSLDATDINAVTDAGATITGLFEDADGTHYVQVDSPTASENGLYEVTSVDDNTGEITLDATATRAGQAVQGGASDITGLDLTNDFGANAAYNNQVVTLEGVNGYFIEITNSDILDENGFYEVTINETNGSVTLVNTSGTPDHAPGTAVANNHVDLVAVPEVTAVTQAPLGTEVTFNAGATGVDLTGAELVQLTPRGGNAGDAIDAIKVGDNYYAASLDETTGEATIKEITYTDADGNSQTGAVQLGGVDGVTEFVAVGEVNYQASALDGADLSDGNADVATIAAEATASPLSLLDDALANVDSLRSELGAVQNRFEDAINNLRTNSTNLSAARSRIEDADYAVEVANMTRAQILQQAGTSVLAQANQIPQIALSLLG